MSTQDTDLDGIAVVGLAGRFPGARATAFAVLIYLYFPIIVLVVLSFSAGDSSLARWAGFSTRWYRVVAEDSDMMRAVRNSLTVACIATSVGTGIATLAALGTARTPGRPEGL